MAETVTDAGDDAEDADGDLTDDIVIKEEIEPLEPRAIEGDDDDVVIMPTEEPVVTEILDETDIKAAEDLNAIDDDVMIQEPKIETQLVPDDDDDDNLHPNPGSLEESSQHNFIMKIKEEPQDDGYEDMVNEEDAFVEVTAIASDNLMQGECF